MSNKRFNFLIIISTLWIAGIFSFYIFGLFERPSSFNELGDFLAGVSAPVGFVWLIFGYIQQGKQLEQNSTAINQQAHALEQQEKALNLQINEMNESVNQQKKVVFLMEQERNDLKRQVKPTIEILEIFAQIIDENYFRITLDLKNNGVGDACDIKILIAEILEPLTILKVESKIRISLEISKKDFDWSFITYDYTIAISYSDNLANSYTEVKKLTIKNNPNRLTILETQIVDID